MIKLLVVLMFIGVIFSPQAMGETADMEGDIVTEGISVIRFGAVPDGKTDCTEAFQKALDATQKMGGGIVQVPSGAYRIATHILIPEGVTLQGQWTAPHHSNMPTSVTGTVLYAEEGRGSEDGPAFITLSENAAVRGFTIFYPEQVIEDVQPYPWTIAGSRMHCTIENVTFVNAYNGIDFRQPHELHFIRNVFGICLRRGIWIDHCTDIGRIENVHFNPHYWARSPWPSAPAGEKWQMLLDYTVANGEAFIFARTDWEYVLNTFCYGYKIGYHFISGPTGPMNGNFVGIGADGSNRAIQVDAANPYGILITNGKFVSMFGDDPVQLVTMEGFEGVLQLSNCAFWGPAFQCAQLNGPGTVSFNQCNFVHWNKDSEAIHAEAGRVTISNSFFRQPDQQIYLGEEVKSAVILGNTFLSKMEVENKSEGKVEIGFNVDGE